MHRNPFTDEELAARLARLREAMAADDLAVALVSSPENIFYLTGLDHWGYFAPHLLIVPAEGEMTLVTRAMERVTIERQVRNARFEGHQDSETAAALAVRLLAGGGARRIGAETWSSALSFAFGDTLRRGLAGVEWVEITGLIERMRLVKSLAEQALMRAAARVSVAGAAAAVAAISDGARETDVAAECVAAMIRAGGEPPGFGPFIRPGQRLGEEHATWGTGRFGQGDTVFLELSGCVARYHAPLGRLVRLGEVAEADRRMAETAEAAFAAVLGVLVPGARAREVYAAWQAVVDRAGLAHYRRHHCGYCVGIGVPPSWTGGNTVTGLRHDSELEIREGMSFHILSWLMGTGRGDHFLSNTVLLGSGGAEVLTAGPA